MTHTVAVDLRSTEAVAASLRGQTAENAHCSCVLTTADSDDLYVLEEFQAPETYHHSFTYVEKKIIVFLFSFI